MAVTYNNNTRAALGTPIGIRIISIASYLIGSVSFIFGLLWLIAGIAIKDWLGQLLPGLGDNALLYGIIFGLPELILAGLYFASAIGLWQIRHWGWITHITAVSLLVVYVLGLATFAAINRAWLVLFLELAPLPYYLWSLIYLLLPNVKAYFGQEAQLPSDELYGSTSISSQSMIYKPTLPIEPTKRFETVNATQERNSKMERTKILNDERPVNAWLSVQKGAVAGRQFKLRHISNLGRHQTDCDVILTDSAISAKHACIKEEGSVYFLYDLASSNGTFLNGQRVSGREMLMDGDQIKLGETVLVFKRT